MGEWNKAKKKYNFDFMKKKPLNTPWQNYEEQFHS